MLLYNSVSCYFQVLIFHCSMVKNYPIKFFLLLSMADKINVQLCIKDCIITLNLYIQWVIPERLHY